MRTEVRSAAVPCCPNVHGSEGIAEQLLRKGTKAGVSRTAAQVADERGAALPSQRVEFPTPLLQDAVDVISKDVGGRVVARPGREGCSCSQREQEDHGRIAGLPFDAAASRYSGGINRLPKVRLATDVHQSQKIVC